MHPIHEQVSHVVAFMYLLLLLYKKMFYELMRSYFLEMLI